MLAGFRPRLDNPHYHRLLSLSTQNQSMPHLCAFSLTSTAAALLCCCMVKSVLLDVQLSRFCVTGNMVWCTSTCSSHRKPLQAKSTCIDKLARLTGLWWCAGMLASNHCQAVLQCDHLQGHSQGAWQAGEQRLQGPVAAWALLRCPHDLCGQLLLHEHSR